MKHIIAALLAVISIATAGNYDSAGQKLTPAQAAALDAETPARIKTARNGHHYYKSKADSDAIHQAAQQYDAAAPIIAQVIAKQDTVRRKTQSVIAATKIAVGAARLGVDAGLWASRTSLPADKYPLQVEATTAAGIYSVYTIQSLADAVTLAEMAHDARQAILTQANAIHNQIRDAGSRALMRAVVDPR